METFCKMLDQLQGQTGLSEEDYCKKLGIPRSTYRSWKYGQVPQAIVNLIKISKFHSVSIDLLIKGENSEEKLFRQITSAFQTYMHLKGHT